MHRRPPVLSILLVTGLFLAACSKKEEPTKPAIAPEPQASPAASGPDATPTPQTGVGAGPLDTSPTVAPETAAPAPSAPAVTTGEQTQPATAEVAKDAVQEAEFRVFFPAFYPLSMRMEGREGRVNLNLEIDPKGDVVDVVVASTTAPEFTEFAVEAARKWKFVPARVNGVPITSRRIFPYVFVSEFGSGGLPPRSPLANLAYVDGVYYSISPKGEYSLANIHDPIPLLQTSPVLTPEMAALGEVSLTLSFTVTEEGRVVNPKVVEGANDQFAEASMAAVVFWQFVPRIRNGKAIQSQVRLPLRLNIPAAPAAEKPN